MRGVDVMPADEFAVGRGAPFAVRVCVGPPVDRATLEHGIRQLGEVLRSTRNQENGRVGSVAQQTRNGWSHRCGRHTSSHNSSPKPETGGAAEVSGRRNHPEAGIARATFGMAVPWCLWVFFHREPSALW